MKATWKAAVVAAVVAVMYVGGKAEAARYTGFPDLTLDPAITNINRTLLMESETITPTGGTLTLSGISGNITKLSGAGTINGSLISTMFSSLNLTNLITVTGGVTIRDGSEIMIGGLRAPAPAPPPPGGTDAIPAVAGAQSYMLPGGYIDPFAHTIYANINGYLTDVTYAAQAVSAMTLGGGERMLGGARAPAPAPPPPGGNWPFLTAASLTFEGGSSFNFDFGGYGFQAGEALALANLNGGHMSVNGSVATNMGQNMLLINSDPFALGISDIEMGAIRDYYNEHGNVAPVPEPSTLLLLGIGLAGVAGARMKMRKKASKN